MNAVLKQVFTREFEVIVVNDGSTDRTGKIAEAFVEEDKRFRLISQENSGPAGARNNGARNARNEIIVFLDSDCVPEKNWLEEMVKPFSDRNVAGVQGAYRSRQKELIAVFGQIEIEHRYELMKKSRKVDWIGSYSAAYKKSIFLEEGGFDEAYRIASGEDPDFSYTLSENGYRLVFNQNAIVWHYHPASLPKYLRAKFYRGYWRVRLYRKHLGKMVSDSYTPQEIKLQIMCFYSGIVFLGISFFSAQFLYLGAALLGMIVLLAIPFYLWAMKRNAGAGMTAPIIILLRTIAYSCGMAMATINGKVFA